MICYLCGCRIEKYDLSYDHVPPRQFFPTEFRRNNLSQLVTVAAHKTCNKKYQSDEDYFVHSLGPLAMQSGASGNALWNDLKRKYRRKAGQVLAAVVSREFKARTESGIVLPGDLALKSFDGKRVWAVVWKIVRGLFYKEHGLVVSAEVPKKFAIIQPKFETPPEIAVHLVQQPSRGQYPDVFDYKFLSTDKFHYWGLCFWREIIMTALFPVTQATDLKRAGQRASV